jgi:lipid-A-disaccharide synthase
MLRHCRRTLQGGCCSLAIVVDSPMLNLPVAKQARRAGVPVLYFIAPQTWAWAPKRNRNIKARVERMAVILPFEEEYFRRQGVAADYVGHPLFDELGAREVREAETQRIRELGEPVIAILPGSRTHVVEEVFPGQLEVAQAIFRKFPHAHFCVSQANDRVEPLLRTRLEASGLPYSLHHEANGNVLGAADLVLVASGTATLEVAYYHAPMIVMYNATRVGYHLYGRWAITTKYLSLVNILAGRRLVPEYMPFFNSTAPIIADALGLLETPGALARMRQELRDLLAPILKTGASANAAKIVLEMLQRDGR